MKKFSLLLVILVLFSSFGFVTAADKGVEVNVFAAASLKDSLDEIIKEYTAQEGVKDTIIPVYEASGTLRKQIEEGADADIFISANQKHMKTLDEAKLIVSDTKKDLLGNALTLIASADVADAALKIKDVAKILTDDAFKVISIGEPSEVPAGQYAKELMENLKVYSAVESKGKLVFGKNVTAVLTYVDGGDADLGFVYHTDAMKLKKGKIVCDAPEGKYTAVNYPIAVLKDAPQPAAAQAFYEYLLTDKAGDIFKKYGFIFLGAEEKK